MDETRFLNKLIIRLGKDFKPPKGLKLQRNRQGTICFASNDSTYLGSVSKSGRDWKFFWLKPLVSFHVGDSESINFLNKFPK